MLSGMLSTSLPSRNNPQSSVKLERTDNAVEFRWLCLAENLRRTFDIGAVARDDISRNWLSSMVRTRMLVRLTSASRDIELRSFFDRSSSSSLLANAENASAGTAPSLLPSNLRLFRFGKVLKPDASVSLPSRFSPRSSTVIDPDRL